MKILIAYDGSDNANAAIATASELLAGSDPEAIVLTIWEPVLVTAQHATKFGSPMPMSATDASDDDHRCKLQAGKLAEHGAWLARRHGFEATPLWVADDHDVASAILGEASKFDVDLVVLGARGLAGIRAFLGSVSNHVLQHSRRPVLVIPTSSPHDGQAKPDASAGSALTDLSSRVGGNLL
jgi:nucleotide-binding universal stress UspA family protein